MKKEIFGTTKTGETASCYELENKNGMKVVVTDSGATVVSVYVKDKTVNLVDVAILEQQLEDAQIESPMPR